MAEISTAGNATSAYPSLVSVGTVSAIGSPLPNGLVCQVAKDGGATQD